MSSVYENLFICKYVYIQMSLYTNVFIQLHHFKEKRGYNTVVYLFILWNFQEQQWLLLKTRNMLLCIKNYVGHKLAIFNAVLLLFLHLLKTQWWDMRLEYNVVWLWEERADSRNVYLKWKERLLLLYYIDKNDTILSKDIYYNFQNLLFKKLLAQSNSQQTYFGNFTRPQKHFEYIVKSSYHFVFQIVKA